MTACRRRAFARGCSGGAAVGGGERRHAQGVLLGRDLLGARLLDVPDEPEALEDADDGVGRSIWVRRRPWRAEVGKAWWLWCQPSPSDTSATSQLSRLSSSVAKGGRPYMWQIEFTLQVA